MLALLRHARNVTLLTAATLISVPALAGFTIDGKPKVTFNAEGSPGFLTFEGITRAMILEDDGTNLVFTVAMDSVETGISLRDDHMRRNYVETDKHPTASLTLPRADVTWPTEGSVEGTVQGSFDVHGTALTVPVTYEIKRTGSGYRVKAEFPFNTSSHGIDIPSYLNVTIKPEMQAEVSVDLVDAT